LTTEKLKSGKYRVRVWDNELQRRVAVGTFLTKSAARAADRQAEMELSLYGVLAERRDQTFGALCDQHLATIKNLASTTQVWYRDALKRARRHFGEKASVRRITKASVQSYASVLMDAGLAANTVRSYIKVVSTLMNYAIELGLREDNPALKLRNLPTRKRAVGSVRAITRLEHERLVGCVSTDFGRGRGRTTYRGYKVMVSVMPFIGLRRSEVQGLTWAMVDLPGGTLRVEFQLRTTGELDSNLKTSKSRRVVSLPDRVVKELRAWKLECPPNALDLVFPSQRGMAQNNAQFYRIWKRAIAAADLVGLDPHDLRHTFATWLLSAGVNVTWVADQMGHESPSITLDTYAHLLPNSDTEAARKLEEWLGRQGTSEVSAHALPTEAIAAL